MDWGTDLWETLFIALLVLATSANPYSKSYQSIDCDDIYRHDNTSASGVYTIYPGGPTTPLHVYCDMDTDGGRWTVFLKRIDGSENFFRPWKNYKTGFGNVAGEYWLGLENIFLLTMRKENELRVDMEDWEGSQAFAEYSSISVWPEHSGYELHLGSFTGGPAGGFPGGGYPVIATQSSPSSQALQDAVFRASPLANASHLPPTSDSLAQHNSRKFTTYDKDQDVWDKNCAQHFLGGFWYGSCHNTNPTAMYAPHGAIAHAHVLVTWDTWKNPNPMKTIVMKIRSTAKCQCTH
ncbi:microfibril-associated glycoprotein 4-like isoform 1-T1 [Pholidichthys leucotaenia]